MVERIKIGRHPVLNDYGIFISKPGVDVNNITTNFLLDSRFRTLGIHAFGQQSMTRSTAISGVTIWYADATFPDLGYRPMWYGNIKYDSANSAGLPVNSAGFPLSVCASYGQLGSGGERFIENGVWWVSNTQIRARAVMNVGGSSGSMTFTWIVFRNRYA